MPQATATIGVVGLAVMGSNLARNLASREGNTVAVYNRTTAKTDELIAEHPEAGFVRTTTVQELADSLQRPRTAIIMVKAGAATDAVIDELTEVFEPGDIIVDGGNALFTDTIRREAAIRDTGIHFVGCGISGGEEGALNGPSLMPGGPAESYETLGPILASIAAVAEDEPCVTHVGTDGAGHFVKMVHNGIEYADMQLIAEAYDLIRRGTGKSPAEIADVFQEWNSGELSSYLIEITAGVLRQTDQATGEPLVDVILDAAGAKGTGAWTVETALDLGVPVSGIAEAVFARSLSSRLGQREAARGRPDPPRSGPSTTRRPSSRTCGRPSSPRRSSPTRRASTRSPPGRPSTAGTSRRGTSRRSGGPAASSAPSSSGGSPRPTPTTRTSPRCCWRRTSGRRSARPRRHGGGWW